ncbi:hypothetical protein M0R45_036374 [Rubus argutus]|uniref:MHC class I antigen n=1 Tax=Rubus argutus TaxID=59490 RepID=A0AAW1VYP0_RUBAR
MRGHGGEGQWSCWAECGDLMRRDWTGANAGRGHTASAAELACVWADGITRSGGSTEQVNDVRRDDGVVAEAREKGDRGFDCE